VHHRNHHDAMSIFVEKAGRNRRVFGASGCVLESYSMKYFLNFCYKFLHPRIFYMQPLNHGGDRSGGLAGTGPVKNIVY
jgi:hypothetical protein